ncbi:MAG: glycine cleavage system protein H, partial [Candidatus Binatia bacterium]
MKFPKKLRYTREHEWVLMEGNQATVGITDFAQHELGEVVYVELPKIADTVTKDEPFGVVESVKAASDLYAPVSGDV